jgi:hypothetical protein
MGHDKCKHTLAGKFERKTPLGKSKCKEDNIKVSFPDCGSDSGGSEHGLVTGCCEYRKEYSGAIKGRHFIPR